MYSLAVMLKWHHQLKNILLIQNRLMSVEDQSTGINEEIHFWQNCLLNLHNIRRQIQRNELQTIIQVLTLSKSAYIQQFLQVENEIQVETLVASVIHLNVIQKLDFHRICRRLFEISQASR